MCALTHLILQKAGCALVGVETAEMSGLFLNEDVYDVIGSTTGAVARGRTILPAKSPIGAGDIQLGMRVTDVIVMASL